jgi:hypothetical protein
MFKPIDPGEEDYCEEARLNRKRARSEVVHPALERFFMHRIKIRDFKFELV